MALYRKYRPGSFGELVGQEQVTVPLSKALDNGRINHAYLFSGPRGCGKTSSARIMARSLNCAQGPTSTPCGVCNSCISLAPNGPGNLDVTELDAASNNSVEDMRELRDRAMYAPAESRYRIFIIDEAHMVTRQGSNALLKIVEEPPAHLIFIFATTEPEKVIGTIRSRTHHYPFRLLTPLAMRSLLERTVAGENMHVEDAVYPLVIRAGGGSPRDTLSVLDQLFAGTGPEGLTYEHARMVLGATDDALIDAAVTALASGDHAGLFSTVDHVIEAGLSPRRFAEDLLDRLRDLIIMQAVPHALENGLVDAPTDRGDILLSQAQGFNSRNLPHIAAILNDGLSSIKGATSPRLLLEILCAKMLLDNAPSTHVAPQAVAQPQASAIPKYERKSVREAREAKLAEEHARAHTKPSATPTPPTAPTAPVAPPVPASAPQPAATPAQAIPMAPSIPATSAQPQTTTPVAPQPTAQPAATPQPAPPVQPTVEPTPSQQAPAPTPAVSPQPESPQSAPLAHAQTPATPTAAPSPTADPDFALYERIRTQWAKVRTASSRTSSVLGILLTEAYPMGVRDGVVVLGHNTGALAGRINDPAHARTLSTVLKQELGIDATIRCEVATDPKDLGFSHPTHVDPAPWNPHAATLQPESQPEPQSEPAAETHASLVDQQLEKNTPTPADQPTDTWTQPTPLGDQVMAPQRITPSPATTPAEDARVENPAQPHAHTPAESPEPAATHTDPWGEPAPLGGEATHNEPTPQPAQTPTPELEPESAPVPPTAPRANQPTWRERAARQKAENSNGINPTHNSESTFSTGVPLPPEPSYYDDAPPPEDPYGYPPDEGMPEPQHNPAPTAPTDAYGHAPAENANADLVATAPTQPQRMPTANAEIASTSSPATDGSGVAAEPAGSGEASNPTHSTAAHQGASSAPPDGRTGEYAQQPAPQAESAPAPPAHPAEPDDEETEMMKQAASEEGTKDRRSAIAFAMDLLGQELGAKPL
ncbi:MAG: DNA polymerase III subunit gamma and tau [Corynebacterium sp.]|uniref:DNA polymerase III subunit gamma and tau n=1 Tax=Corynebacterium sp. TaxID=1720 RepID=UPI0026DBFF34|nr:DNA polymerase III subunit gamma and tau [Corynebacterium sp.]MDO4761485.1 DNA polymerase III subunit gamma and tau [Corynebacterium sp.]